VISIKAIKMLGQNFLVDNNVITRIIDLVDPVPGDHILEVGPGQGALTRELAASGASVLAVELDRRLAPMLSREFANNALIDVVEADILKIDLRAELSRYSNSKWKVAANLPYNISSQVLIKFLETPTLFSDLYLMLQKEVGDRLAAPPSCKEYGILTVFCRLHFDVTREFIVRPGSFHPVPKVDSAILHFKALPSPRVDVGNEQLFRRVVKAAFGQRRKTLWNCLKSAEFVSDQKLSTLLADCRIDPVRRGETLNLDEFAALTRAILAEGSAEGKIVEP
jgi:16S rRNA (adenine1518-N6/adenine1519-N6)-dimethyltransferase